MRRANSTGARLTSTIVWPWPLTYHDRSAGALATATNNGADRLDVLIMFACLMGMIEDGYEFRGYINHFVAFENEGWANYESFATLISGITATTR